MSSHLAVGDILELSCDGGVAYVSYAGKHSWLGDAIWVVPELFATPQSEWSRIFAKDGYFAFYAVDAGLRHKHLRRVGYALEAMSPIPVLVRTAVNKDENGAVTSWLITDGVVRIPKKDAELSADERLLPIGAIWNYKLLCERLVNRWKPVV
jgi:hypothetical protein